MMGSNIAVLGILQTLDGKKIVIDTSILVLALGTHEEDCIESITVAAPRDDEIAVNPFLGH